MGFEQTGKLHTLFETNRVSERFTKREFVIEVADNPKYPQVVLFQVTGDRCSQLDGLQVGDEVRVEFSLRGRVWNSPKGETKYFNSLDAWRVELVRAQSAVAVPPASSGSTPSDFSGPDDDLPFLSASASHEPDPRRAWRRGP